MSLYTDKQLEAAAKFWADHLIRAQRHEHGPQFEKTLLKILQQERKRSPHGITFGTGEYYNSGVHHEHHNSNFQPDHILMEAAKSAGIEIDRHTFPLGMVCRIIAGKKEKQGTVEVLIEGTVEIIGKFNEFTKSAQKTVGGNRALIEVIYPPVPRPKILQQLTPLP